MRDDEGCQGNPPCQPASAYFSPLALAINTASPGELPDQTQLPPCRSPLPPAAPRSTPPYFPRTLPPRLLLLTCLSTCALPSTVTNQPPRVPLSASPVISRFPSPFIFGGVFLRCALSLPPPTPPPPSVLMNLSRKSHFMQHRVLETLLNLFIYELSFVRVALVTSHSRVQP